MKFKIIKNPNEEVWNKISKAIKENNYHCPCVIDQNEDTKCICKEFREKESEGMCRCGAYFKVKE